MNFAFCLSKLRLRLRSRCVKFRYFCSDHSSENVVVSKIKHLHLIGINRPEKRNCINSETAGKLKEAFMNFEKDDEAYAGVLYGKGGNFCAGYDLEEISRGAIQDFQIEEGPMGPTHMFLSKPVVASVNGYAVAGGLELALWCDLRVMEESAVMGVFNRRFGVPLVDGCTVRLPQLIGLSNALDLILTGRAITASEARNMGLVHRVVPTGTGLGTAINLATSLCKFPQKCLRADRYSAYHSEYQTQLKEALKFEAENAKDVIREESITGARTFVQGIGRHGSFHLDDIIEPNKE